MYLPEWEELCSGYQVPGTEYEVPDVALVGTSMRTTLSILVFSSLSRQRRMKLCRILQLLTTPTVHSSGP